MALKLDSTINNILDIISKKTGVSKEIVYLVIDYKFKKIKDVIKQGNTKIIKLDDGTEKTVFNFKKIRLDYFMTLEFLEKRYIDFNKKFNENYTEIESEKEEEQQQDSESEFENNIRLLGNKKLF